MLYFKGIQRKTLLGWDLLSSQHLGKVRDLGQSRKGWTRGFLRPKVIQGPSSVVRLGWVFEGQDGGSWVSSGVSRLSISGWSLHMSVRFSSVPTKWEICKEMSTKPIFRPEMPIWAPTETLNWVGWLNHVLWVSRPHQGWWWLTGGCLGILIEFTNPAERCSVSQHPSVNPQVGGINGSACNNRAIHNC